MAVSGVSLGVLGYLTIPLGKFVAAKSPFLLPYERL